MSQYDFRITVRIQYKMRTNTRVRLIISVYIAPTYALKAITKSMRLAEQKT